MNISRVNIVEDALLLAGFPFTENLFFRHSGLFAKINSFQVTNLNHLEHLIAKVLQG